MFTASIAKTTKGFLEDYVLNVRWTYAMMVAALVIPGAMADGGGSANARSAAGGRTTGVRSTAPETRLVGINLYWTGLQVIQKYGNPNEIQAVGAGGGSVGPGGGAGAGRPGGGPAGRPVGGGGGIGTVDVGAWQRPAGDPFGGLPFMFGGQGQLGDAGNPVDPLAGNQGGGGPRPGQAAPGGGGTGGGGAPTGGSADSRILFTRWVYRVGPSRYGFIFDKSNRVIQIEAIGMGDNRVYTNRGIRFGSTFADIIRRYGAPDGYEINGDALVVRYLVRQKVAFRMNRLQTNKPHVVTGVVVAAGKI